MARQGRTYTEKDRRQAAALAQQIGVAEAALKLRIPRRTLSRWVRKLEEVGPPGPPTLPEPQNQATGDQMGPEAGLPGDWSEEVARILEPLPHQHQAFVLAYVGPARFNGRLAADLARFAPGNPDAQAVQAHRLLSQDKITEAIRELLALWIMPAEEITARIAADARLSMADFLAVNEWGVSFDFQQAMKRGALSGIKKLTIKDGTTPSGDRWSEVKLELKDAQAALRDLARIHGLFIDKLEHSGSVGLGNADELAALGRDVEDDVDKELEAWEEQYKTLH